MKKLLLFCAATMAMALTASAETYLAESFDYAEGNLYGNGKWVKYGKKTTAPIQVAKSPLTFAGYQDNAAGKAVRLTKESGEYCQMLFRDKGTDAAKGTVYYSALVNVSELPSGSRTAAFMALTGANSLDATKFGDTDQLSLYLAHRSSISASASDLWWQRELPRST